MNKYPRLDVGTDPVILRLVAEDLVQNYILGMGGLPLSLPDTLLDLADYIEECRRIDENDSNNHVKLQGNPISPRDRLGLDSDDED